MTKEQGIQHVSEQLHTISHIARDPDFFPHSTEEFLTDLRYEILQVPPHDNLAHMLEMLGYSDKDVRGIDWNHTAGTISLDAELDNRPPLHGRTIALRTQDFISGKISEEELTKRLEKRRVLMGTHFGGSGTFTFELPTLAEVLYILSEASPPMQEAVLAQFPMGIPTADVLDLDIARTMGIHKDVIPVGKEAQYILPMRTVVTDICKEAATFRIGVIDARSPGLLHTGVLPIVVPKVA